MTRYQIYLDLTSCLFKNRNNIIQIVSASPLKVFNSFFSAIYGESMYSSQDLLRLIFIEILIDKININF